MKIIRLNCHRRVQNPFNHHPIKTLPGEIRNEKEKAISEKRLEDKKEDLITTNSAMLSQRIFRRKSKWS